MWRTERSLNYLLFWSLGFLFGALGWLINLIPIKYFSSEHLFWLIDISITLISVSSVTYGFFIRSFKSFNALWFFAAGFIALHWIVYFSSIQIDYGLKMAISPFYIAVCMQIIVYIMWLKNKRLSSLEWVAALICQASVLVHLARAYLYSQQPEGGEQLLLSAYDIVSFLVLPIVYTATGAALMLIIFNDKHRKSSLLLTENNRGLSAKELQNVSDTLMWQCERSKQWVSIMACKVNHFKYIKQHYGHAVAEEIEQSLIHLLSKTVANQGYVGHVNDAEFVIALPMVDEVEADKWAKKLQIMVIQLNIRDKREPVPVTLSVGHVSSCKNYNFDSLLCDAEAALKGGRQLS